MLERLAGLCPAYPALLITCALAQGRGVPLQSSVWRDLTQELHPGLSIESHTASSVVELAAPYLRMDQEAGQTVFRPAHALLRDFLLGNLGDVQSAHGVMARYCAARASNGQVQNPYFLRHATSHARSAGTSGWFAVDRVANRVWDHLAPGRVVQDAMESLFGVSKMPAGVSDVISTFHSISQSPYHEAIRQWAIASRSGRFSLGNGEMANFHKNSDTFLFWARGLTITPPYLGLKMPGPARQVTALCHVDLGPGQGGLLAGTRNGEIVLWDPRRSANLRRHRVPGTARIVTAVCGVVVADTGYEFGSGLEIVGGTSDGRVIAWRSLDGSLVWQRDLHRGRVSALTSIQGPNGEPLIACLTRDHLFILGADLHVQVAYSWRRNLSPCIAVGAPTPDHRVPIAVAFDHGGVQVAWLEISDTGYSLGLGGDESPIGCRVLDIKMISESPITIRALFTDGVVRILRLNGDHNSVYVHAGTDSHWRRGALGSDGSSYLAGSDGHVQFAGAANNPGVAPIVRSRHGGTEATIAIFKPGPAAELIATGGRDGIVRVWDTGFSQWREGSQQDAAEIVHLCDVNGQGHGLGIKADGQGAITFINFGDARKLGMVERQTNAPRDRVVAIASSFDRRGQSLVAIASESAVSLWREDKDNKPSKAWPDLVVGNALAVSVDGTFGHEHVAVGHGTNISLWTSASTDPQLIPLAFQAPKITAIKVVRYSDRVTRVVVLAGREVHAYEFSRDFLPFAVGMVQLREDPTCAAFFHLPDAGVGLFYGTASAELRVVPDLWLGRLLSATSDNLHLNTHEALVCVDAVVGDNSEVSCFAGGIHGALFRTELSTRLRSTRMQLGQTVISVSAARNGRCLLSVSDGYAAFQLEHPRS